MSLKHAILVQLETEPSSGYDLLKQFNERMGYFWNAKHQQIYQQLKVLAEQDLITCTVTQQEGKPDKKVYAITRKGITELRNWLSNEIKPSKVNEALLVKIYGGHLADEKSIVDEITRHLSFHQHTLAKLLTIEQSYLNLPPEDKNNYKLPYLTLRRGIISEQAWIDWAEESLNTLKK